MRHYIENYLHPKVTLILLLCIGLSNCNNRNDNNKSDNNKAALVQNKPIGNLTRQIYYFAPQLDSITGKATGACDCCSSNLLFLNDTLFVAVDYCIGSDAYYKGRYIVYNDSIIFRCDSLRVYNDTEWDTPSDSSVVTTSPSTIRTTKESVVYFNWKSFYFKNKLCFKTSFGDIATIESDNPVPFIDQLKTDSIWTKLEIE